MQLLFVTSAPCVLLHCCQLLLKGSAALASLRLHDMAHAPSAEPGTFAAGTPACSLACRCSSLQCPTHSLPHRLSHSRSPAQPSPPSLMQQMAPPHPPPSQPPHLQ